MQIKAFAREDFDGWLDEGGAASFVVQSVCHEGSEQLVFHLGGMLSIRCRTCNRHVCNVVVNTPTQDEIEAASTPAEPVRLKPSCHPKAGLRLTYSDGGIQARCGRCRAAIQRLTVKSSVEDANVGDHG